MNKLAHNLKQYRELAGLTQKMLADKLNITVRSYQRYEAGEREPKLDILISIVDIFGISLDDLVGHKLS